MSKRKSIKFKLFFYLVLFLISNFSSGLYSFEFPSVEEVKKLVSETNFSDYPDADEILVINVQKIKYNTDGTGENLDDVYLKILTEKGRSDNRTIRIRFHSHYQQIQILQAELIKESGVVVPIDIEQNTRISINHHQMHSNIYDPNQKILTLNVPGLEIGDIIHYRYLEKIIRTRMPNTWSDYLVLQSDQPIREYKIEVCSPDQLPIAKFAIKDEVPGTVNFSKEKIDGYTIYRWHVKDVPQVFPEPDMPPLYTVVQRLLISTISSWEEISKWYWNLCQPRLEKTSPAMEEEVKRLCEGKNSDEEKIRSIFDFVSQKIRYMGITPEEEAPGYEPHDVCLTFENKYGVCRDKAALLVSMLRLAGINAFPVLIMAGPKKDPDVPTPYFNHAIVAVEKEKGSYILMDMTNETTGSELLPAYLSDKSYLVARPEGDTLRISPIIPAKDNLVIINTTCEIRDDLSAKISSKIEFKGINDSVYRNSFIRRNKEQTLDFIENILKRVNSRAVYISHNLVPKDLSDNSLPLQVNLEFEIPQIIAIGERDNALLMPVISPQIGMANFLLDKMGLIERRFPLTTEIACGVIEKLTISLPAGIKRENFVFPVNTSIDDESMQWTQKYDMEDEKISYQSEFLLKLTEFSKEQYPILRKNLGKREKDLDSFPIYASDIKSSEALQKITNTGLNILSDEILIELESENSWTETLTFKAQLLDFSAKREISEIKFYFNEALTKPEVIYARVTTKDGKISEISDKEINIMDQPWTSSAPRYPRGKILVMNLPAVDLGSVIEYRVKFQHNNFPFFSMIQRPESFHPIVSKKVQVLNPKALPLKIAENENAKIREKFSSKKEILWEFKNLSPLRKESNIPPIWASKNFVAVSTGDWLKYKDKIIELIEDKSAPTPEINDLLKNILKRQDEKTEQVKLIRDFVSLRIRDAGVKFNEIPLSSNADVNSIIMSGYGNSLERAIVIVSFLKSLKIPYSIIPCSYTPFLRNEVSAIKNTPLHNFIDAVLVKVNIDDKSFYLNESDHYAELESTPLESRTAIFKDDQLFHEISVEDNFTTGAEKVIKIILDDNGSALLRHTEKFYGIENAKWKKFIKEMTPEKLRRFFQERASEIFLASELSDEPKANFDKYPGEITLELKISDFANFASDRIAFVLPDRIMAFDQLNSFRENPYFQNKIHFVKQKYLIALPEGFSNIELKPEPFDTGENARLSYMKINSSFLDGVNGCHFFRVGTKLLSIDYEVRLKPEIYRGNGYIDLMEKSVLFNSPSNNIVLLRK